MAKQTRTSFMNRRMGVAGLTFGNAILVVGAIFAVPYLVRRFGPMISSRLSDRNLSPRDIVSNVRDKFSGSQGVNTSAIDPSATTMTH